MDSNSYIIFQLNNEEYGIEIENAQEILRMPEHLTHLPNVPSYVVGIINIRGKVIPVIDLKKRFELTQTERKAEERLIILNINDMLLAIIIDDVNEIVNIDADTIQNVNMVVSKLGQNCLAGIGRIDERLILLLDAKKLGREIVTYQFEMEEAK